MKKVLVYCFLPFVILVMSLSSCSRDGITEWDTDLLVPLAEAHLGVEDLIPDSNIISDNGAPLIIRLNFDYNLIPDDSLLKIPDTLITDNISLPVSFNLPSGFEVANISQLIRFSYKDVKLTEALLESGYAEFSIINSLSDKIIIGYDIPESYLSRQFCKFSNQEVQAASADGLPFEFVKLIDLSNHSLDLRGDNLISYNRMRFSLNAMLNPDGDGASVVANTPFITYKNKFFDLKPAFARGFLGQSSFQFNDGSDVEIMKKISGLLSLEDLSLTINLENSIGADFNLVINNVEAVKNGTSISLQHSVIGSNETISRAQNISSDIYPYTPTQRTYSFTTDNSNIKSLAELLPDRFNYDISAQLNPLGNVSSGNDFVYSSSNIKLNSTIELPLKFSASNLAFRDTITFEGLNSEDSELVNSGELRLIAKNKFPMNMSVQLEFLDTNKTSLQTFFVDQTIPAAAVNSNLRVEVENISTLIIPISDVTKAAVNDARFIVVTARIDTQPEDELLPIYADYFLGLQLIGDGKYRIQVK